MAHAHTHMLCQELVELVTDYLEGALDPQAATEFEQHLAFCAACTLYVDQIRAIRRETGALTYESVPETTRAGLLEAFRDWSAA